MRATHQSVPVGPYAIRNVSDLVPDIEAEAFRRGVEGRLVVVDSGTGSLPGVRCRQIRPSEPPFFDCIELDPREVPIQRPVGMPDQGPGILTRMAWPAMTITRLRNVICIPGGIALRDGAVLADSFNSSWERSRHAHMLRDKAGDWHLSDRGIATAEIGATMSGPVLFLDHQNEALFGHFIADIMSRAWAVDYCRAFLGIGRLRSLCAWPAPPFAPPLIEAAGIALEDIAFFDRPVLCEELIVATKAVQTQEYAAPPAPRLFQRMRDRIAPPAPSPALAPAPAPARGKPGGRRIYVSRRTNPTRMLDEEEGVERLFVRHGFEVIHPARIDVRDQIRAFADARLIAGCGGSSMFNVAFVRDARAVMILASPLLVHYSEQLLLMGAPNTAIDLVLGFVERSELILRPGYVHARWHIDLLLLEQVISDWVSQYG